MAYELPPLPYSEDALEPYIDAQTVRIHHNMHHQAYVSKLNDAISSYPDLASKPVEELVRHLDQVPEDIRMAVRNNGGGHLNHSMFWEIMKPESNGSPYGALAEAIDHTFGSFANFQEAFNDAGMKRFGSGWVWLVKDAAGTLSITSTANQDNPISEGLYPILGNDIWEHAYYLKYQNRRQEYLEAWWNLLDWGEIGRRFSEGNLLA